MKWRCNCSAVEAQVRCSGGAGAVQPFCAQALDICHTQARYVEVEQGGEPQCTIETVHLVPLVWQGAPGAPSVAGLHLVQSPVPIWPPHTGHIVHPPSAGDSTRPTDTAGPAKKYMDQTEERCKKRQQKAISKKTRKDKARPEKPEETRRKQKKTEKAKRRKKKPEGRRIKAKQSGQTKQEKQEETRRCKKMPEKDRRRHKKSEKSIKKTEEARRSQKKPEGE